MKLDSVFVSLAAIFGDQFIYIGQLIGTGILHVAWQGFVVLLAAILLKRAIASCSPELRYSFYVCMLVVLVSCLPFNLLWLHWSGSCVAGSVSAEPSPNHVFVVGDVGALHGSVSESGASQFASERSVQTNAGPATNQVSREEPAAKARGVVSLINKEAINLDSSTGLVCLVYMAGVLCMICRLLVGMIGCRRICARAEVVSSRITQLVQGKARQIGIRAVPMVLLARGVCAPLVTGLLRPAIVLPASVISGLTIDELEQVILHELAHIRRLDLFVNFFQRVAETLLFFHPAVWLLNRLINSEREVCCDNYVVRMGCEPTGYASALLRVAEVGVAQKGGRGQSPVALSALGHSKSDFRIRVTRLLGAPVRPKPLGTRSRLLTLAVGVLTLASLTNRFWSTQGQEQEQVADVWHPDPNWNYNVDVQAERNDISLTGVVSLKLNRQAPSDSKIDLMVDGENLWYAQFQYGTRQSKSVLVAVERDGSEVTFYVDRNRDRHLTMLERVGASGRKADFELDAELVIETKSITLKRHVALWYQPIGNRLNIRTLGATYGSTPIDDV